MNDPYSVLGITPGADEETIKKAYRQKCKQYHPDLHPDDPTCEDKFKDVQAAYSEVMRMRSGGGSSASSSGSSSYDRRESPEMQAANNYIRNGYYAEAMNVLEGIASADRAARWHYYAALASSGLGNNIRAQNEARTAVDMEPGNYEYQNLLDRLQNPGRAYSTYQQAYTQPGSRQHGMNFCLQAWLYLMLCNLCSICCCGGRGGFYIC